MIPFFSSSADRPETDHLQSLLPVVCYFDSLPARPAGVVLWWQLLALACELALLLDDEPPLVRRSKLARERRLCVVASMKAALRWAVSYGRLWNCM